MHVHSAILFLIFAAPMVSPGESLGYAAHAGKSAHNLVAKEAQLALLQEADANQNTAAPDAPAQGEQVQPVDDPADNTSAQPADVSPAEKGPPEALEQETAPETATPKSSKSIPKPDPAPAEQAPPSGMGTWAAGALQVGTGCLTAGVLQFCGNYIPPLKLLAIVAPSFAQTIVGNKFSQKRGAWLPSCLTGTLTELGCGFASLLFSGFGLGMATIVYGVSYVAAGVLLNQGSAYGLLCLGGVGCGLFGMFASIIVFVAGGIGSVIAGQVGSAWAYHNWGEPKKPGDEGTLDFPGFFSPKHPKTSAKENAVSSAHAMAY